MKRILWNKITKIILILGLCFFALWGAAGYNPVGIISGNWLEYTSSHYNFRVEYPGRWSIHVSDDAGYHNYKNQRVSFSNDLLGSILVQIDQVDMSSLSESKVADWAENLIEVNYPDYASTETVDANINGKMYLSRTYDANGVKFMEVYISREIDGIVLRLRAVPDKFDDALPIFYRIVASFETLNSRSR